MENNHVVRHQQFYPRSQNVNGSIYPHQVPMNRYAMPMNIPPPFNPNAIYKAVNTNAWTGIPNGFPQPIYARGLGVKQMHFPRRRTIRQPFTERQKTLLFNRFAKSMFITGWEREELAAITKLTPNQVKTWFQNRRAKVNKDARTAKAKKEALESSEKPLEEQNSQIPTDYETFSFSRNTFTPFNSPHSQ